MNAITLTINPTNDYRAAMQQAAVAYLYRQQGQHLSGDHQLLENCKRYLAQSLEVSEHLVQRINTGLAALEGERPIDIHRTLGELTPAAEALLAVALGVADGAALLVVDAGDGEFASPASSAFAGAVATVAGESSTLVLGLRSEPASHAASVGGRPLTRIDLTSPETASKGALR